MQFEGILGTPPQNIQRKQGKKTARGSRRQQIQNSLGNEITQIEEVNGTQPENLRRKLLGKQLEKAKGNNFRTPMGMSS